MKKLRSMLRVACAAALCALCLMGSWPALASTIDAEPRQMSDAETVKVNINSASAEQLQVIPGVGPATAERIVAFREEHGKFKRAEDLLKIKGIGERSFEKIRPYVTVGAE